jgi:DNA polymerase-3 subunit gamma/tau
VLDDPARHIGGSPEEIEALTRQAGTFSDDELLRLLELIMREEQRVKNSAHPRYLLEAMSIKLARLADLQPLEELIARFSRATDEPGAPPGPPAGPKAGTEGPPMRRRSSAGASPAAARTTDAPASRGPVATEAPASSSPAAGVGRAAPPAGQDATPQSPPPASAAGGDSATVETILKRVHEERGAVGGFLSQARWVEIVGDVLEIAFGEKQAFFRDKVASRETVEYLGRVASEIAGHKLVVKVVVASAATIDRVVTDTPVVDESARKDALRREALQEPLVKTLLETFEGEIVDVEQA